MSCLQFSPTEPLLASGSWDHTVRLWEPYKNTASLESYDCSKEVLALSFHPDGNQLCVSTLSGSLSFWNIKTGSESKTISGRKDITGGRLATSAQGAVKSSQGKSFTSVTYSADGTCEILTHSFSLTQSLTHSHSTQSLTHSHFKQNVPTTQDDAYSQVDEVNMYVSMKYLRVYCFENGNSHTIDRWMV